MEDFSLYPTEEPVAGTGLRLPKAVARSRGGMLTGNVQAGAGTVAGYREREADLYRQGSELFNAEPDMSQMQAYARQRGEQGQGAMLNALAAQFAGESFQPVQAQFLKKAAAAQDPMKVSGGLLTPDGQFLKDPGVAQDKKAEFLLQQAKAYGQMALTAETAQAREAALAQQRQFENMLKTFMAETGRMNANTAAGGGGFGAGTATQIGSGQANEPILRTRNGQLFTYDANGQAVPYAGPVLPKAGSAQPTEDERKAAGWFFQADNARRNIESVLKNNPAASAPTITERGLSMIPRIGEDIANFARPEDRQKFVQAASSLSEALLRAATGAGVNRDEAEQKVRELTPVLGEKPGTTQQKLAAYDVYMKSLQARAGRALPQNAPGAAPVANDDPLGFRGGR